MFSLAHITRNLLLAALVAAPGLSLAQVPPKSSRPTTAFAEIPGLPTVSNCSATIGSTSRPFARSLFTTDWNLRC